MRLGFILVFLASTWTATYSRRQDSRWAGQPDAFGGNSFNAQCSANEVATGFCASGRTKDCMLNTQSLYTSVKCRRYGNASMGAYNPCRTIMAGEWGSHLLCHENESVVEICASGQHKDCGTEISARLRCCADFRVDHTRCRTLGGRWGVPLECAADEVMVGACSSGADEGCSNSGSTVYNVLHCCRLTSYAL